jgi:hypothetical protein
MPYNNSSIRAAIAFAGLMAAAISFALLTPAVEQGMLISAGSVYAQQEDWKTEFESVCAKAQDPGALSDDELKNLIDRCDKLRPVIEKLEETQRKVYLKRLQMCRNLFDFILKTREKK